MARGRRAGWTSALAAGLLLPALCLAIDLRVVGVKPGRSADIMVGDRGPITLNVGEETPGGALKLLQADRSGAVLRVDGITKRLPLSAAAPSGAGPGAGTGGSGTMVVYSNLAGQFVTGGTINGHVARFMVDTGATSTALSRAEARRIGLDYRSGVRTQTQTVNGVVGGWRVTLDAVRVGDTTVRDVGAIVVDNDSLPVVLLGMTFLNHFDMHRQGATLVLRRR